MDHSISFWLLAAFILLLFISIRRRLRLQKIPGPFLASFTDLWRFYRQNFHGFTKVLAHLHERYGSVVRIGPNTVSFSDSEAVAVIYNSHGDFTKADSYHPVRGAINGEIKGSVIDMQDEAEVSQLRRAIGSTFAEKNILDYEDDVDETCDELLQAIRRDQMIDLFTVMCRFQADFLSQIAFGEKTQHLETGADIAYLSSYARLGHWMKWQAMPFLERLIYKPPFLIRYLKAKAPPLWARMANIKLQARLSNIDGGSNQHHQKPDLLSKYIAGGEKRGDKLPIEAIPRMVTSTISAGFDTTAFTMTTMLYFLCRTPEAMTELRGELAEANLPTRASFRETQPLKYLNAVLKEAMRLYPFLQLLLEREVPAGGATICRQFLPSGTVVGCHPSITHMDASLYGQDANVFRPERWLVNDPRKLSAMERASLGFGNGKRICIGRHLAEMEIKKVIPRILLAFDVEIVDPDYTLAPIDVYTAFPKPFMVRFSKREF